MSAPTRSIDQFPSLLTELDTSESIALSKILSDDRIVGELEQQFGPVLPAGVAEVAAAQREASIDAALPSAVEAAQYGLSEIERHETALQAYGLSADVDATNPGDAVTVFLESEYETVPEGRELSPAEAVVAFAALRKAAHTPGYRLEATDILAQHAPSRLERARRRAALRIGIFMMTAQRSGHLPTFRAA